MCSSIKFIKWNIYVLTHSACIYENYVPNMVPKKVISLESSNYSELIAYKMIVLWTFVLAGTSEAF